MICDPLDYGGGRTPIKKDVPGCPAYTGTLTRATSASFPLLLAVYHREPQRPYVGHRDGDGDGGDGDWQQSSGAHHHGDGDGNGYWWYCSGHHAAAGSLDGR
ncbi:hypothetical protein RJZ56_006282 [Blastomyces dermatitidis]